MEKDKQVIPFKGEQALVRVNVQLGLVNKVLEEDERLFLKPKKVVLKCESGDDFVEFIVDSDIIELDLSLKKITGLPIEIGQLTNLKKLWLFGNHLTILPVEIGQLTNLTELYLSWSHLSILPVEIGQLINLRKLYLENNPISDLEKEKIMLLLPNCDIQ